MLTPESHTDMTLVLMAELFKHSVMLLKSIKSYYIGSLQHEGTLSLCQLHSVKYFKLRPILQQFNSQDYITKENWEAL